jgi:hypothetical protein
MIILVFIAKKLYNDNRITFLNETLLNIVPTYEDVANTLGNNIEKKWYDIDYENLKNSSYFFDKRNINMFDVILLDGGEYHTYFEYLNIKDKTKIICLDDVNTMKCNKIYNELVNDPGWELYKGNLNDRNGWAIFKKLIDWPYK